MTKDNLDLLEYNSFYQTYIDKAAGLDFNTGLKIAFDETIELLETIEEDKLNYRYKPDKWTIKEILQHLIDSERIFSYRAVRIARGDKTPLAGFEQDDYIVPSGAINRTMESLLSEYKSLRESTIHLFNSFPKKGLKNIGIASNSEVSVRAIGFIIMGHERHHCEIIRERYL